MTGERKRRQRKQLSTLFALGKVQTEQMKGRDKSVNMGAEKRIDR